MSGRDNDIIELLDAAKFAVVEATHISARPARARLAAALRKVALRGPMRRLGDKALAASEFLREMAWMTESVDPGHFDTQRREFAAAMDLLIFELDLAMLKSERAPVTAKKTPHAPAPASRGRVVSSRTTLAERLNRWLGGRLGSGEAARGGRAAPRSGFNDNRKSTRD